ncbi:hypothetical protein BC938DRAFT_472110 [Jimgerdemannia flammicorona]|uniref:Uncharacterized protein n=1 Tax=Jimgerdemannia flammicorona TaxID=994334 RepID=A0A433QUA4_9FUNG|nr:hypothetical protein BC938DRAFT_472110 [Jimgerdemannia flammicorona]
MIHTEIFICILQSLGDNPYSMASFMPSQGSQTHTQPVFGLQARLIVAIDFGTTHSGYGMVHIGDSSNIIESKYSWPDQPAQYPKNLTALRYKCDSNTSSPSVQSWGYSGI